MNTEHRLYELATKTAEASREIAQACDILSEAALSTDDFEVIRALVHLIECYERCSRHYQEYQTTLTPIDAELAAIDQENLNEIARITRDMKRSTINLPARIEENARIFKSNGEIWRRQASLFYRIALRHHICSITPSEPVPEPTQTSEAM